MSVLGQHYERQLKALTPKEAKARGAKVPIMLATARKLLRIAYTVMLRREEPHDPYAKPKKIVPVKPENLMSQTEYARMVGKTRQAIAVRVKKGTLAVQDWEGHTYIVYTEGETIQQPKLGRPRKSSPPTNGGQP